MNLPVSKNFVESNHTEWDIMCMVVDHVPPVKKGDDHTTALKKKELQWIYDRDALKPNGLNVEFKSP